MKVYSVNISEIKGQPKHPVEGIMLVENSGVEGDAHKGSKRQVSLMAEEEIEKFNRENRTNISPGMFAENITTQGIDLPSVRIGQRLKLGGAEVEVTQIGKECHQGCSIRQKTGSCIMPEKGVFARVTKPGRVKAGDQIIVIDK